MPYLLDADTFIRAKNDHYSFALCPGFWEWLIQANADGSVFSVKAVLDDLLRYTTGSGTGPDELAVWARQRGSGFFLEPNAQTLFVMADLATWVQESHYRAAAARDFLDKSDSWLVAEGSARGFTVVTHEKSQPQAISRVKIPDACEARVPVVECITPFEMLRRERVAFVLEGQST